jgi:hypothetical protein
VLAGRERAGCAAARFAAAGVVVAVVASAGRWTSLSRATCTERRRTLPGDDLVPDPMWEATRAATVRAAPDEIWPWLVQMGYPTHRAGWYTPFWLDRLLFGIRTRSADRIVPELQHLAVGDRVLDSESGDSFFTVARIEPGRALALRSHTHPLPLYRDVDFAWAFILEPVAAGTRLLMRARVTYTPVWPAPLVRLLIRVGFGIGDVVQAGGMLAGIRRRAETHHDHVERRSPRWPPHRHLACRAPMSCCPPWRSGSARVSLRRPSTGRRSSATA